MRDEELDSPDTVTALVRIECNLGSNGRAQGGRDLIRRLAKDRRQIGRCDRCWDRLRWRGRWLRQWRLCRVQLAAPLFVCISTPRAQAPLYPLYTTYPTHSATVHARVPCSLAFHVAPSATWGDRRREMMQRTGRPRVGKRR